MGILPFHRGIVARLGETPLGMLTVPEVALDIAVVVLLLARLRGHDSGGPAIGARLRIAWTLFLGCATVSFALRPTGFGLTAMTRLVVVGVVVGEVARRVRESDWTPLTVPLSVAMAGQGVIAIAQRVHGGPIGLSWLGERRTGFKPFGSTLLPAGTTVHTNTLGLYGIGVAALLLAAAADRSARRSGPDWAAVERVAVGAILRHILLIERVGLVACAVCIGMSGSRTAAIATLLVALVSAVSGFARVSAVSGSARRIRSRGDVRTAFVIFVAAITTSVVANSSVWIGRATQSSGASVEQLGSGRMALIRQSLAVFRLSPVTGVGPGNYLVHVLTDPAIIRYSAEGAPVHNIWLAVLATYGLVGVAAFIVLTVLLLDLGRRAGLIGALIGLPMLVTLGLDVATTLSPGYLLLAVSIGVIGGVAARTGVSSGCEGVSSGCEDESAGGSVGPAAGVGSEAEVQLVSVASR